MQQSQQALDADVLVVGAGISGLCAARRLQEAGVSVQVLEARDRVGGRTLSQEVAGGIFDLGAQWIGPTQDRVAALAHELGVKTFRQYNTGRKVLAIRGERRTFRGLIPKLSLLPLLETGWTLARLDRLARKISVQDPMQAKHAQTWDALDLETWLQQKLWTEDARQMVRLATNMIFAAEPKDLSFLFFLLYLRAGGGIVRLAEIDNGAQQDRFVGGAQQLSLRLAEEITPQLHLQMPVRQVAQSEEGATLTCDGRSFRGRFAIMALAPAMMQTIDFSPTLPPERQRLHSSMPMGSVIKCIIRYEKAFWRDQGFSGEALGVQGPIRAVFDATVPDDGGKPALVAFFAGEEARTASALGSEGRKQRVVSLLTEWFGPEASEPLAYVDQDWLQEAYSGGCYTGIMGPGALQACAETLRKPCGRLHFAGTETATQWMGYLDGAIQAGERAADEILRRLQ